MRVLAQTLNCLQLGDGLRQFNLGSSVVHFSLTIGKSFFGALLGFECLGFVQVGTTDRGVGQHGHGVRLHFQQATGQLESTARMRSVRRDVARVKTILNQKAAAAAASN